MNVICALTKGTQRAPSSLLVYERLVRSLQPRTGPSLEPDRSGTLTSHLQLLEL